MTKDFCKGRFLLTFDDGPHANTASILEELARNPVQEEIKTIFFVQTRHAEGGGSRLGRALLRREHAEGHVLGLHTGTAEHVSHTSLSPGELDRSLSDGMEDLRTITRERTVFVRPPYWRFNSATLEGYTRNGLHMVLSDAKAYDGVDWGFHIFRRWNFRSQLHRIFRRMRNGDIPADEGTASIVVTFHDTNTYTASHLTEYLDLLVEEAERVGLPLNNKPFYDSAPEITRTALRRAISRTQVTKLKARCVEAT